jgi:hypothetical protein
LTGIVADWQGGRTDRSRRAAAVFGTRHAPVIAGVVLGLAAATEAAARGGSSVTGILTGVVLALCTTVPLAFLGPAAAGICVCVAGVLSLTVDKIMTVAGLAAVLIVLYRFGRDGGRGQLLAPALAVPFPIVALAGSLSPGT